jgi:hypothetical protein
MILCTQCQGGKTVNVQEAVKDPSGNSENFTMSGPRVADGVCQQCNGTGVQYS